MDGREYRSTRDLNPILKRIDELGLAGFLGDLDAYGFAVVPPEKVATRETLEELRATVLRIAQERTGRPFALEQNGEAGDYRAQPQTSSQFLLYYLLMADPVFERWLMNPALYALVSYLMKGQQQLSSMTSFVKWQGDGYGETLGLHSDTPPGTPDGLLPSGWQDVCNATYCLTDYSLETGALAVVPGSHRYCRQPKPGEGVKQAVPVEAEEGSLIVWHGNLWHGAFAKKTQGLRLNLTTYFCHRRLKNQENYQWRVTEEMLKRNPPEFGPLVGADDQMGWDEKGPDYGRILKYGSEATKRRLVRGARDESGGS